MLEIPDEKNYINKKYLGNPKEKEPRITMTNSIASIKTNYNNESQINNSVNRSYRHNMPIDSHTNEIALNFKAPLIMSPKVRQNEAELNPRSNQEVFLSKITL